MKTIYSNQDINRVFKKYLRFKFGLAMLFAMLFSTACEDVLDEQVYSSFTANNFFTDVPSAEMGMYGIYDRIASWNLYGETYSFVMPTNTDILRHWRQNRGKDEDLMANYQHGEINSKVSVVWSAFYDAVNRANIAIDGIKPLYDAALEKDNPSSGDLEDLVRLRWALGESYFLRGFLYYQLVKTWGDVPLKLSSESSLAEVNIERTPKEEVLQQVEKDILLGIEMMPEASQSLKGRANRGTARGILTRVYLTWAGEPINDVSKYPLAAEQALAVIQSGEHSLNTNMEKITVGPPEYQDIFPETFMNLAKQITDVRENMWEMHFSILDPDNDDTGRIGSWHGVQSHKNSKYRRGDLRNHTLPSFYDSFEESDSIRRDWSISTFDIKSDDSFVELNRDGESLPKYGQAKYRRYLQTVMSPNHNNEAMNWIVLRYADVLLMYAEAVNETILNGGSLPAGASIDGAYEAINQVRRRAHLLPLDAGSSIDRTGNGGAQFQQEIRDERAWELCGECVRKHDLIRWGILVETVRATGAWVKENYPAANQYIAGDYIQDHHIYQPIPMAGEISQNPDILNTDPTNNGYR